MDRGTSDKVEVRLRIPPADRQKQRLDVRVNGQAMMFDDGPMAWQDFKGIAMYYIYPKYSDTLIHLCRVDSSTLTLWTVHFQLKGCLVSFFTEIPVFYANSVDPDQMLHSAASDPDQILHSAASDLGLHCLPMSLLWDARLKWVYKVYIRMARIKINWCIHVARLEYLSLWKYLFFNIDDLIMYVYVAME